MAHDDQHAAGRDEVSEANQPIPLINVMKHGHCGHDVEGARLEVGGSEIAKSVFDVVVVGPCLLDAGLITVEADDAFDPSANSSGCLTLAAPDIDRAASRRLHVSLQ